MGVSGCGKTTVGKILAEKRKLPFYDADNFHLPASIEKMKNNIALNDEDRMPWLEELSKNILIWERNGGAVLACSALKEKYREVLQRVPQITWIYLNGTKSTILKRLQTRNAHFMSPAMLDSQFEALEKPAYGLHIDVSLSPHEIVQEIILKLNNMISFS